MEQIFKTNDVKKLTPICGKVYNFYVTIIDACGGNKMLDEKEFRVWLTNKYIYSPAVVRDIVSRFKRADRILEFNSDDAYQFRLEQKEIYKSLSVSVRSQIKKAVKLYQEYKKEDAENQ